MVVGIHDGQRPFCRRDRTHRNKPVLGIIGVGKAVILCQVTVGVVGELRRIHLRVLIEVIRGISVRDAVRGCNRAVADGVVGVLIGIRADGRRRKFVPPIVEIRPGERLRIRCIDGTTKKIEGRVVAVDRTAVRAVGAAGDEIGTRRVPRQSR